MSDTLKTFCLALTGASGQAYGLRLLECLLTAGCRVRFLYSDAARVVLRQEMALELPDAPAAAKACLLRRYPDLSGVLEVYAQDDWFSPLASGSSAPEAMVICPCSMGTLAGIAQGLAANLIERAADVALKEGKKLILTPRETPFSILHLENMLRLAHAGATILPPNPGFYQQPQSVADMVDFVVARILDQLAVPHTLLPRWGDATLSA
ncbi:MAG: UbiX family flavin prenyltransferase [Zoogloeaceae bacterium]|jgi:4-hydroxy-3-polyprenylbenzoate decarboxylase|nr:UbiX family flavin prenyltransferase [Zoogloeaceae bacterium]